MSINSDMSQLEIALIKSTMLKLGIMPYTTAHENVSNLLLNSTPEESQKMKRKFRKLWKKVINLSKKYDKNDKQKVKLANLVERYQKFELIKKVPLVKNSTTQSTNKIASRQKLMHKEFVLMYVKCLFVDPLIESTRLTKK